MITRKSKREIEQMKKAGELLVQTHKEIAKMIKPGITTMEINEFAEEFLNKHGATPEQKGYNGYPYAICASINDEICHGFPRNEKLKDGDIVTIDMVVNLNGGLADSAWTYALATWMKRDSKLMEVTKTAIYKGIEQAQQETELVISVTLFKHMQKEKVFPLYVNLPGMESDQRSMKSHISLILAAK